MSNQERLNTVTGRDGWQGRVIEENAGNNGQTLLELPDGRRVLVPTNLLERRSGSYYLPLSQSELTSAATTTGRDGLDTAAYQREDGTLLVPLVEEQLDVQKRSVLRGQVRLQKTVQQREETVSEALLHDEVQVERVPINQVAQAIPPVRQEGDTMIIPVLEEVLVVEKRLMVREEVRITRQRVQTQSEPQRVTLRREEITVDPPDAVKFDGGTATQP